MIAILVAIIVAAIMAVALFRYADGGYGDRHLIAGMLGIIFGAGAGIAAIFYAFTAWSWLAAGAKAEIINREYGTHYTREEVFFASDVIDTIREIDRRRVEVNGDLFRKEKDQ